MNRREQSAQETRQRILTAARKLFAEHGYAQTKVEEIAAEAGVATVTIYSSAGGKAGILHTLIEVWTMSPIRGEAAARIATATDPDSILDDVAGTMRRMRETFADVIYALHDAAPFDKAVADNLALATERYQGSCRMVAQRLEDLKGLRRGITVDHAADILWFYFGYWSWFTLHNESGWSYGSAEKWLLASVKRELLETPSV